MASIRLNRFAGIRPLLSERALGPAYAQVAHNALLHDGSLRPMRGCPEVKATPEPAAIWEPPNVAECCPEVMCSEKCVSYTHPASPGCRGFGWAVVYGDGDPKRVNICDGTEGPLCVPAPPMMLAAALTAPVPAPTLDHTGPDERAYTYTWVDQFGVESAPALATHAGRSRDGSGWTLTGFAPPPANVCAVRLYRTVAGIDVETAAVTPEFQLVTELPPGTSTYVDSARLRDLQYGTLLTAGDCCAPEGLTCVRQTELGFEVGFIGNELVFSERNEPHNWPDRNRFTLPERIMGVEVYGDIVYIGTQGRPYRALLAVGTDPLTNEVGLQADIKPYGMVAPLRSFRNLVATPDGAFLASERGLFALTGDRISNVSRSRIEDIDWPDYRPHSIEWVNGQLFGSMWPTGRGWLMDMRFGDNGQPDFGDLVTIDYGPLTQSHGESGRLLYSDGDSVRAWGEGPGLKKYTWRSKVFVADGELSFSAAKVVANYGPPVQFTLFQDGEAVYSDEVSNSRPFLLPACGRGTEFEIELCGTTRVHEVHVATSIPELTEAANQ